MRRSVLRPLSASLCALLLASAAADAQDTAPKPAAPPPAVSPAPQAAPAPAPPAAPPSANIAMPKARIPHPQQVRPVDAPTPSMEDIKRAFDPTPGGMTADEIVKLALEHSPELRKAELSEDTAKANEARAKIAFAPRIDLLGKYTRLSRLNFGSPFASKGPPMDPPDLTPEQLEMRTQARAVLAETFSGLSFQQQLNQWYTTVNVTLPVTDMFLTVIPQYKGVSMLADVAARRKEASELQVSYDARMAFYGYAHVIGAVVVAQRSVQLYEANVRDLEALVQAGTATETDLIRARSELAKMKVHVVEFTGQLDVALARLAVITGTDMDGTRGIGEPFVGIDMSPTPEVSKLANEAKRTRPEIVALRKLEQARTHLATAKRGAQYPQLRGFFNGYAANPHPRIIPQQNQWNASWDVGVSLAYSPNDSIFAHTQYKDALTDLASVQQDLRLVEDGIDMEAAQACSTHRAAVANTQAATESLESARRYQADQRSLLLAGAATPNDVLESQLLLTRSALEWVDSFISVRMAEAALLKAQGKTGSSATSSSSAASTARSTP